MIFADEWENYFNYYKESTQKTTYKHSPIFVFLISLPCAPAT